MKAVICLTRMGIQGAMLLVATLGIGCSGLSAQPDQEAKALEHFEQARLEALAVEALNPTDRQRSAYDGYLARAREALDAGDFEAAEVQTKYALASARRIHDRRMEMHVELDGRFAQIETLSRDVKVARNATGVDRAALFGVVNERMALAREAKVEGDYELALAASDEALLFLEHREFAFGSGAPQVKVKSKRKPRRRGAPPLSCRAYRLMNK